MRQNENIILQAQSFAARDIMSFGASMSSASNPLDAEAVKNVVRLVEAKQSPSLIQRVVGQPQKTIPQTVLPKDVFQVSVKESAMVRSASSGPVTDGAQQVKNRAQSQKDTEQEIGRLTARLQKVQGEANDAQGYAADDLGINRDKAANSFASDPSPTKIGAGVTVACDMATGGGGTFATILMQGRTAIAELTEKERKCSPDQQENLLNNELARLQSSGSNASVSHANQGASVKWDVPSKGGADFSKADTGTLRDIHALNFDKLHNQVPEMAGLHDTRHGLKDVEDNHGALENKAGVDFGDVYIASASISGIMRMNVSGVAANDAVFGSVSPIGSSLSASAPEYHADYSVNYPAYM